MLNAQRPSGAGWPELRRAQGGPCSRQVPTTNPHSSPWRSSGQCEQIACIHPPPPRWWRVNARNLCGLPAPGWGSGQSKMLRGFVFCRNTTQRRCDSFHSPIFDILTCCAASSMAQVRKNQASRSAICSTGITCCPLCVISCISQPRPQGYLVNKKIPFLDHHRALVIDLM